MTNLMVFFFLKIRAKLGISFTDVEHLLLNMHTAGVL